MPRISSGRSCAAPSSRARRSRRPTSRPTPSCPSRRVAAAPACARWLSRSSASTPSARCSSPATGSTSSCRSRTSTRLNPVVVPRIRPAPWSAPTARCTPPYYTIDEFMNNTTVKVVVQNVQVLAALPPQATDGSDPAADPSEVQPDVVADPRGHSRSRPRSSASPSSTETSRSCCARRPTTAQATSRPPASRSSELVDTLGRSAARADHGSLTQHGRSEVGYRGQTATWPSGSRSSSSTTSPRRATTWPSCSASRSTSRSSGSVGSGEEALQPRRARSTVDVAAARHQHARHGRHRHGRAAGAPRADCLDHHDERPGRARLSAPRDARRRARVPGQAVQLGRAGRVDPPGPPARAPEAGPRRGRSLPAPGERHSHVEPPRRGPGQVVTFFAPKGGVGRTTLAVNFAVAAQTELEQARRARRRRPPVRRRRRAAQPQPQEPVDRRPGARDETAATLDTLDIDAGRPQHRHPRAHGAAQPGDGRAGHAGSPRRASSARCARRTTWWSSTRRRCCRTRRWPSSISRTWSSTVLTLEITNIKNIRQFLALAEQLGYRDDKVQLVLNRADSGYGIRLQDVESSIGRKISHTRRFRRPHGRLRPQPRRAVRGRRTPVACQRGRRPAWPSSVVGDRDRRVGPSCAPMRAASPRRASSSGERTRAGGVTSHVAADAESRAPARPPT